MAVTLTVETGAGLTNSNTYLSLADAVTYIGDYISTATGWDALASDAAKNACLAIAGRWIDMRFEQDAKGYALSTDQAMMFPRGGVGLWKGAWLDSSVIPQKLKDAQCEVAVYWADNPDELGIDLGDGGAITDQTIKLGDLDVSRKYGGVKTGSAIYSKVKDLMAEYLEPSNRLIRG